MRGVQTAPLPHGTEPRVAADRGTPAMPLHVPPGDCGHLLDQVAKIRHDLIVRAVGTPVEARTDVRPAAVRARRVRVVRVVMRERSAEAQVQDRERRRLK